MHRGESMTLRKKIIIIFTSIIILVFTPLVFIMQTQVKEENRKQVEKQVLDLSKSKANEIDLWINQRILEIKMLMEFEAVENLDLEGMRRLVDKINASDKLNPKQSDETFAMGLSDGKGYISYDEYIDVSDREYFKSLLLNESEYVISKPVLSKYDNQEIFLITLPLLSEDNQVLGFINGSVSLDTISKIANDIDVLESNTWIMNHDQEIYSTTSDTLFNDDSEKLLLGQIKEGFKKSKTGIIKTEDHKNTLFYQEIPNSPEWILCTSISNDIIDAQTNSLTMIVINTSLVFLVIFILLAFYISQVIIKPIASLSHNMEEVSKGNLNAYTPVKGNDEISSLAYYFNTMLDDIKSLLSKTKKAEQKKRTAELKSLQAQINPHFLYNTLDTLQWKALESDNEDVADMVNMLSGYFRIVLSDGDDLINISQELDHLKYYLKIQELRYGDIMTYNIECGDSLINETIPKIIIQPLVENSIYHGLKMKRDKGHIDINITDHHTHIKITVKDDGVGINESKLEALRSDLKHRVESNHYGLYNINERLHLYYGDNYSIEINSLESFFTEIILLIPKRKEDFNA